MPFCTVTFDEAEGDLPSVCLRCGARAVCRMPKTIRLYDTMSSYSRGVLGLIFLLIDLNRYFSSPTLVLRGPFCASHQHHWSVRRALIWGVVALMPMLMLGVGLLYLLGTIAGGTAAGCNIFAMFTCILTAAIIYGTSTVKFNTDMDNECFTLSHVHPKFIEALDRQREEKARDRQVRRTAKSKTEPEAIPTAIQVSAATQDKPNPFADLDEPRREPRRKARKRASNPNVPILVISLAIGVPIVLLVLLAVVIGIGKAVQRGIQQQAAVNEAPRGNPPGDDGGREDGPRDDPPREVDRDVEAGTVVPKAPPLPPLPPALDGRPSVDLIPLMMPRKDVVHGRWLVADNVLHCNDGSFVPRVQFPYEPPKEYDFVVTFYQPNLGNGISLIMPNPNGGSFFWFLGNHNGAGYGFHANPDIEGRIPGLIKKKTIYTTVVQVRTDRVRALLDGKELMQRKTDFRELRCDDWRRIHNTKFVGVACDDPTVFYNVRIVEVTGPGKKGR